MPVATIQDIADLTQLPVAVLPVAQITAILTDAYYDVIGEDIDPNSGVFAKCHKYRAMSVMEELNIIGKVTQETVDNVSSTYEAGQSLGKTFRNGWDRMYRMALAKAVGSDYLATRVGGQSAAQMRVFG